jgi:hypothetical protein
MMCRRRSFGVSRLWSCLYQRLHGCPDTYIKRRKVRRTGWRGMRTSTTNPTIYVAPIEVLCVLSTEMR